MFGLNSFFHRMKNTIIGRRIGYIFVLIFMFFVSFVLSYLIVSNSKNDIIKKEHFEEKQKIISEYENTIKEKDEKISGLNKEILDLNSKIEEITSNKDQTQSE